MWPFGNRRIYLDYASSTLPLTEAISVMRQAEKLIGNPGAIHAEAVAAKGMLEKSREKVARELACKSREIIFTGGLTEAINLAILGCARKLHMRGAFEGTHWIVSSIEHAAVLESFAEVERLGGNVTHLDPDERGIISQQKIFQAIRENTVFISIGWANNEIGIVQPIRDISRTIKEKNQNIIVHSDAGQAPLYLAPQVHTLGVDLMSLGSNKLYGPHGVGALYVATNIEIAPTILGGGQERGLRSGTENVALAAGFAEALAQVSREREREAKRLRQLRDAFAKDLEQKIPGIIFNTDLKHSLPHMLNISIPEIQSEYITLSLDHAGIAISTKSACAEGGAKASHVVAALGGPEWRATNTLRFSLGRDVTRSDLSKTASILAEIVRRSA
ncbi:MAG TPA: cysteine desulfurase family protein [Candidatus Paceibacterota bacterium]|nr:cysteine desulfurase family protein [Candidatus Paceibacterota bacterium]